MISRFVPPLIAAAAMLLSLAMHAREPWTTSRVHGSPEPPSPYVVQRAFTNITFVTPLDAGLIPGTKRMVIVEQRGKLWTIVDENAKKAEAFADVREFDDEARECYSVTFHPKFAENRQVFVWMNLDGRGKQNREDGTRIVRFKMLDTNPPRLDMKSGQVIFSWLSGGHNGGSIRFGRDGMLYISTGDAEAPDPPDSRNTGQDISDVLSSVLRLDVDHAEGGRNYSIPKDNPFLNTPNARGEVWAYGFRNPWRMSFDSRTGEMWVADVGWELWEMVHRVERGGNYGWSITEAGKQDVHPNGQRGPTPIQAPLFVHPHDEAASITGGEVYYGKKFPELDGAYIYGDWQFGTFWSLKVEGSRVVEHRELCRTSLMPAGFGVDANGEMIICDHGGGGLYRFARNPDAGQPSHFPTKLSETGLFADVAAQKPAAGVVKYKINAHRWADHATSERWIGIPGDTNISVANKEWGVVGAGRFTFPKDTVLALTYSIEMEAGEPRTRKRVETQIMHFNGLQWGAYSYRWNDKDTDAELIGPKGAEINLHVKDAKAPGGDRQHAWKFFARSECLRCHTIWNNFTPGFTAAQLKPETMNEFGIKADPKPLAEPYLPDSGSLETRARSYLHVNCSVCHREAGGGAVRAHVEFDRPLKDTRLVDERPVAGTLGLPDARVIASGDPGRSVLLYRMTTGGRGHMPYLGGRLIDDAGVLLVRDWVNSLKPDSSAPQTDARQSADEVSAIKDLASGNAAMLEKLLASPSGALRLAHAVIDGSIKGATRDEVIHKGAGVADPLRRDLFERFLPPDQRRKVLGPNFDSAQLLATKGDAAHGKELFTAICATCHHAADVGADFGPDLSKIATKWNREGLLEQIAQPGKVIEPAWNVTTVTFNDGETVAGFIAAQDNSTITLKIPGGTKQQLQRSNVKSVNTAKATLMPEGLLENLSAQEAADLLEFLSTRK